MPKHVHAELIKLWADGAEIQHLVSYLNVDKWVDCVDFDWLPYVKYRLKPKSKTIKDKNYVKRVYTGCTYFHRVETHNYDNVFSDKDVAGHPTFVDWIDTEWQEIEVPE